MRVCLCYAGENLGILSGVCVNMEAGPSVGLSERRKGRSLWFFTVYRGRLTVGGYCANVRSWARKVNLPGGGNNALFVNLRKNPVVFFFYAIMIECNTMHKEMEEYE